MDIQAGQRVRISDAAFPGSDDPADVAARGQEATVRWNLPERFGPDPYWSEAAIVTTDDGWDHWVKFSELEPLTAKED